ncbi:helix-turn-helix transcriptional regulator [Quadrisphaera granulorum]|uniref:helix-turn-helix transcriptional regulator n=1 Tax=Quadrisphaera granulorum TaxID=317664 RepID=UPI001FE52BA8|nr:helix-turn-helix transcriptional regulator [Quadrisphaera granulorum]
MTVSAPPPSATRQPSSPSRPPGPLGDFLRARREALTPERAGVHSYGRRRVQGLRREEVAQIAGVSVAYYTRLEQGTATTASVPILEALARALLLTDDERTHLLALAGPRHASRRRPRRAEHATPAASQVLAAVDEVPAILFGRRNDVLGWNRSGHALFAGHLPFEAPDDPAARPNFPRMVFLDPHVRGVFREWRDEASRVVAGLRFLAGAAVDDPAFAELVGELSLSSPEFAALWSRQGVVKCSSGTKLLRHPQVGDLDVDFQVMELLEADGQRMVLYTAPPGSSSAHALALLRATTDA